MTFLLRQYPFHADSIIAIPGAPTLLLILAM
jgi:hypothetical protein